MPNTHDLKNTHIRRGYFKEPDRTISRATPCKNEIKKWNLLLKIWEIWRIGQHGTLKGERLHLPWRRKRCHRPLLTRSKRMRKKRHFPGTFLNFFLGFFIEKLLFQLSLLQPARTRAKRMEEKQKGFFDEMRWDEVCAWHWAFSFLFPFYYLFFFFIPFFVLFFGSSEESNNLRLLILDFG